MHAWFEDRGPVCTLLVYVDDATSRLMALSFAAVESTFDLTELFTLQATCRISRQLTVHYKRDLYLLEDAIPNRRLRGATVVVSEAEDGTVTIRANGRVLASRLHPKDHAHLDPGVVVEHKHLDGVFAWIAAHQQERDATRLANPKISGREMHGSSFSGDGARAVRDLSVDVRDLLAG